MQSSSFQSGTQLGQTGRTPAVAPFRAAGKTAPRRQRVVTTNAIQDSVPDVAKKAVAAFAAAAVAFTPFAANAAGPDLGGLVNKAEAAKDKAAGAVKDAVAGDASGKAQGAIGDAKSAAGSLKQGGSDIATKPVAFDGRRAGLQVNVGAPSLGGVADKAKAGVDKAVGAAKSASGDASGKVQGAAGDAKSAAGSLKQGGGDIATKPVAFAGSRLQVNVGDSGEPATLLEKNKKASANTGGPKKESPGSGQQTGKGIATKPVAFSGNQLQVDVGLPDAGGLADKAKAGVDKAVGAAKSASGDVGGKVQGAKGDAKSAAGSLKQGGNDIATKPVAFVGSRLQVNVVDSGEPATLLEKNKKASANTGGPKKESPGSGQQTGKGIATKPVAFSGNRLQVSVGLPDAGGLADKAKAGVDKAVGAAKSASGDVGGKVQGAKGDAKSAAGSLKQGGSDIATKPVAFDGSRLQVNVGLPDAGGLADKAKAGVDKAVGAAKSASGDVGGKVQGAKGDAKSAAGSLKQGGNGIATKPVAFAGSRLQVNVVDSGEPATLLEKNKKASANTGGPKKESPGSGQQTGKGIATKPVAFGGNRLQVNVGLPDAGGLADKAKAGVDKAVGAAKSASGDVGGKVQGAKGDAKSAAGSLKQGGSDIATKPVAFDGSRLQVNVVDSGEPATLLEKNKKASANTGGPKKESPGSGQQTGKGIATKPVAFSGNRLQVNVGLPDVGGLADKAKAGADKAGDAKDNAGDKVRAAASDAKTALGGVKQGEAGKDIATKPVAFSGSRLQVNVANPNPVPGGVADKDKASSAKVGGAGPDATGDARGAAQGASGDAKTIDAARKDKQALKQSDAAFTSSTGLQVNVSNGVFGRGEVGTQTDQINKAGQDIKDTAANPAQSIKNAADRTGQVAERVLSNPAGGPEKSKDAAEKLANANAAVPQALSGGAQKIKDAVTSPASFNIFASTSTERMEA